MSLNEQEKLLVEAIDSMLQHDAKLGLKHHDSQKKSYEDTERGFQYLHGHIDDTFRVKATELTHYDGICAAFAKVHNYKYIDDPTFREAMEREMVAQGIPAKERAKAHQLVQKILDDQGDEGEWAEKDSGFHPNLDEIMQVSQPEQDTDLEIL